MRPEKVNQINLSSRIRFLGSKDRSIGEAFYGKAFYLKPRYFPWSSEVWVTKRDVFLPHNFNHKTVMHQNMDIFRALCLFHEHEVVKPFILWVASRKIGYTKRVFNLLIRTKWRRFLEQ